jgi:hypothetical protein
MNTTFLENIGALPAELDKILEAFRNEDYGPLDRIAASDVFSYVKLERKGVFVPCPPTNTSAKNAE